MENAWFDKILPILNAAGIPLLSAGLLILILTYRKAIDTYRDLVKSLSEENFRLRQQLRDSDSDYFEQGKKVREMVSKGVEAAGELQARKIELLGRPPERELKEVVLSDVEKINEAIGVLKRVSEGLYFLKRDNLERGRELERIVDDHEYQISKLADQIADNTSKVILISVVTPEKIYKKHNLDNLQESKGLVSSVEEIKKLTSTDEA